MNFSFLFIGIFVIIISIISQCNCIQSIRINGTLLCKGKPHAEAIIKLYDDDVLNNDDFLAQEVTDVNGYFVISGKATDLGGKIDPIIKIYHVPKGFVSDGSTPKKTYNYGTIALENQKGKRKCMH
uniref:Transthyretin-like family-containing protein n=1 Tax=Meloidogyne hapla TaxID=6305 RepID=A0A1I8BQ27_MELHA